MRPHLALGPRPPDSTSLTDPHPPPRAGSSTRPTRPTTRPSSTSARAGASRRRRCRASSSARRASRSPSSASLSFPLPLPCSPLTVLSRTQRRHEDQVRRTGPRLLPLFRLALTRSLPSSPRLPSPASRLSPRLSLAPPLASPRLGVDSLFLLPCSAKLHGFGHRLEHGTLGGWIEARAPLTFGIDLSHEPDKPSVAVMVASAHPAAALYEEAISVQGLLEPPQNNPLGRARKQEVVVDTVQMATVRQCRLAHARARTDPVVAARSTCSSAASCRPARRRPARSSFSGTAAARASSRKSSASVRRPPSSRSGPRLGPSSLSLLVRRGPGFQGGLPPPQGGQVDREDPRRPARQERRRARDPGVEGVGPEGARCCRTSSSTCRSDPSARCRSSSSPASSAPTSGPLCRARSTRPTRRGRATSAPGPPSTATSSTLGVRSSPRSLFLLPSLLRCR